MAVFGKAHEIKFPKNGGKNMERKSIWHQKKINQ